MAAAWCDSSTTVYRHLPAKIHAELALAGLALLLALAGCGGDDEPASTAPRREHRRRDDATTETTAHGDRDRAVARRDDPAAEPPTSPEDSPAARATRRRPTRSRCSPAAAGASPRAWCGCRPFISIRVELRSADGGPYALRFGRRTLTGGAELVGVAQVRRPDGRAGARSAPCRSTGGIGHRRPGRRRRPSPVAQRGRDR